MGLYATHLDVVGAHAREESILAPLASPFASSDTDTLLLLPRRRPTSALGRGRVAIKPHALHSE